MTRLTTTLLGVLALAAVQCHAFSMTFNNSLTLDNNGKYKVFWNFNETDITFQVRVQTKGYVGFGISPNGDMLQADVVMGWVKDGHVHFTDRHTTAHAPPVLDKSQDWHLLHGEETDLETVLTFTRKLDTCDDEDIKILDGTVRLIYSWSPADPTPGTTLSYHGVERRGSKSISLLSPSLPLTDFKHDNIKIFDFRNQNYQIPSKDTTYLCTAFQLPDFGGKHHMIAYEPLFTPGNERHIHHIVILRCDGRHPDLHLQAGECYDSWPKGWPACYEVFIGWATGAGAFYLPDNTGYSVGAPDDLTFYIMQTHYDNPTGKSGMIDSSGIRMKLTPNLRRHDLGTLTIGHSVSKMQVVPPQEQAFVSKGYCADACLQESMAKVNETEIRIVSQFQHAHLLGVGVTTRHFRNGVELEPIAFDPNYDFDFQEMRKLKTERVVRPGDSFSVECTYNTMNRANVAFGGLTTRDEMCLTFMYHYPKLPIIGCDSVPTFDAFNMTKDALHGKFMSMNWSDASAKADFKDKLAQTTTTHRCRGKDIDKKYTFKEQETTRPYVSPHSTCPKT